MLAADSTWYSSSWLYGLREKGTRADGRKHPVPWNFSQALSFFDHAAGQHLLDVGCAEGHFLWLARQAGFDVTGVDFNPTSLAIAKEVFGVSSVHQCSVEELADRIAEASYDVVTIFEVLEHTADPFQAICSVRKVLKPGGSLLLSVPGRRRWPALFHPVVDAPPHHLTLWTEDALRRLLDRAGFRVLDVRVKPLIAEDLGVLLKWRLQETLRGSQTSSHTAAPEKSSSPLLQRHETTEKRVVRQLAKAALSPICWALRLNPSAGGFTLFARSQKI